MTRWFQSLAPLFLLLILALPAHATFAVVQHPASTSCTTGTACLQTVSATGAGNLIVANLISEVTSLADTVSTCCANGCSVAWVQGPHVSSTTENGAAEVWYCLSSTAGATSIGPTWVRTATSQAHITAIREFSGVAPFALNSGATPTCTGANATSGANPVTCTLTVSANNSVYAVAMSNGDSATVCSNSYVCTFPSGNGEGYLINETSYLATTWTASTAAHCIAAIALQESSAAAVIPSLASLGVGTR